MKEVVQQIARCVELGKVSRHSPYPAELKDQDGVDEMTRKALQSGISPRDILFEGMIEGMGRIGEKFRRHEVFLPEVLMAARAMTTAMEHLRPYFSSGAVRHRGTVVMGTVAGDLHDIGKKIVSLFLTGAGWRVIDLGVDVPAGRFIQAVEEYRPCAVGLSALLTTTMASMKTITAQLKTRFPTVKVLLGGAPLFPDFATTAGADLYAPDPQTALDWLDTHTS